ncbi:carbohydrate ABC transporter permease [Paenibacillus andongensis]|uniref:carbohydrate ABC transporter permease n=1 Tax=Paenibacillus andongensis TaxID=2975482 RepID=UPI0021BB995D|nr:carbohydrate ABC transporter permease [Paenibacillus andongensis]
MSHSDAVLSYENKSFGRKLFVYSNYSLLAIGTLISLVPLWNILCMSFSSNTYVSAGEVFLWPKGFTFQPYSYILSNVDFYRSLWISIERTVLGIIAMMVCTILAAYPLSREQSEFRSRPFFIWYFLITMLFSGGLIPWFMVVKWVGLYNNLGSLVIVPAVQVFHILIMMNFIRSLPKEIEESAYLDGAGHFQTLVRVLLPLCKPSLATLLLFAFVFHWNNWFDGFIFMSNKEGYPLQTYLYTVLTVPDTSNMTPDQIKIFANLNSKSIKASEIFVSALPILVIYPFLQKYFTKGIVLGSVKG